MDKPEPTTPLPATTSNPVADTTVRQLNYTGKGGKLFSLWIVNWILTILTLGVYHFWAKTKVRRFFHENTLFLDEPFTYLGTGREIFVSAIKFVLIFVLPFALVAAGVTIFLQNSVIAIIVPILYGVIFYCIKLYATLSGMRYRANRMSWRGLRFALKVRKGEYLGLLIRISLLNLITLGLYRPYGDVRFLKLFINNTAYGNLHFTYDGDAREVTRGYWINWILVPFTFGASLLWYRARLLKHIAKSTKLGKLEFRYNITGGQLFWLGFSNGLLLLFSFGILGFYALQRKMFLFVDTFRLRGMPDFAAIKKASAEKDGAGAADYLGADEDFGF
ncbi:MAG: DUF898 family protein [Alphaproteobacteria bacterium]|nr:DUF898 family protein [Alphaproteobacteria bacterium]